ncbi:MAG TPA: hypothetical protein VK064_03635 [Wenzhouxiangella sp.]|nr:hypothetical protein [Wenzhouxiangella sp.]
MNKSSRTDRLAAFVAALVGMLALLVAAYTAWIQRQQVRAEVWPSLLWMTMDSESRYVWMNKGMGPALVNSVEVMVDDLPVSSWNDVFHALQFEPADYGTSTLADNVLAPGETLPWLVFKKHEDLTEFRSAASDRVHYRVCYCSTLGDCWINDSRVGSGNPRLETRACPKAADQVLFEDH